VKGNKLFAVACYGGESESDKVKHLTYKILHYSFIGLVVKNIDLGSRGLSSNRSLTLKTLPFLYC